MAPKIIAVIGALDYDLVMVTNRAPDSGESLVANNYFEGLGGKGANAAIATYRASHRKPQESTASSIADHDLVPTTTYEELQNSNSDQGTLKLDHDFNDDDEIQVRMVGAVGDDKFAELFYTELKKNGVETSGVVTVPGTRSSVCFVIVEDYTRENRCLFTLGATASWTKEDFMDVKDLAHGPRPDLVIAQMEIRKEVVEQMIETAGKANIDFLLNAAPADPLTHRSYQYLTHMLVNGSEAAIMSGRELKEVNEESWSTVAEEFLARGVKNMVITLGAKGAYYANATDRGHVPAYRVSVVDSTGAGGTFTGAYATEYVRQKAAGMWDIRHAVTRANKASALTVGRFGAQKGIPWSDEIDELDAEFVELDMADLSVNGEIFGES